jgi:hypothetical protein
MSGWSYNQIDVRISQYENILGDTNPEAITWEALSRVSLVRGRPTITPSTIDANQLSIPGRMGKPYSLIAGRTNAVLQFELLVADAWPFEELADVEALNTVEKRVDYVKAKLAYAKRVCYKEPGRTWSWFFEIYKTEITENDADERACVLQIKMEVFPFKFDFTGNTGIIVNNGSNYNLTSLVANYPCNPVYMVSMDYATANNSKIRVAGSKSGTDVWSNEVSLAFSNRGTKMVIDTNKLLVYETDANQTFIFNAACFTTGNIDGLRLPKKDLSVDAIKVYNNSSNTIVIYPRSGVIV